jgi:hypothetical protein
VALGRASCYFLGAMQLGCRALLLLVTLLLSFPSDGSADAAKDAAAKAAADAKAATQPLGNFRLGQPGA